MKAAQSLTPLERLRSSSASQSQIMQSLFELNSTDLGHDNDTSHLVSSYEYFFLEPYYRMIAGWVNRQEALAAG